MSEKVRTRGRVGRGVRDGLELTRRFTTEVSASIRHRPGLDRAGGRRRSRPVDHDDGTDVHRRIAARRAEVAADDAFARQSRTVSLVLGIVLAGAVAAVLFLTPVLSVREIEVAGLDASSGVDADQVLRSAGVHEGENLLLVSSAVVTGGVETVPGVESASVHKTFPGKVRIDVVPRVVVAVTPAPHGFALLDGSGTVVEVRADVSDLKVPVVRGSDAVVPAATDVALVAGDRWEDGLGRQAVSAVAALPPGRLPPVLEAGFEGGALTMTFANTPKVVFGTADAIEQKADVVVRVLADLHARGAVVDYVDVSSPIVPTIRPK